MQHWQAFLWSLQTLQSTVFLYLASGPGWKRNAVMGRAQTWHSLMRGRRCIRRYPAGPRHVSHRFGVSASSTPPIVPSFFSWPPSRPVIAILGPGAPSLAVCTHRDVQERACAWSG